MSKDNPTIPVLIATVGGAGFAPKAPGTAGALVGVLLYALLFWATSYDFTTTHTTISLLLLPVFFLGVWATNKLEVAWGHDPSKVVVDELIGQWIALLWIPVTVQTAIAGFILFRFFDILKPLFINKLEALPGGWGVMMDDVLAGVYANLILQLLVYYTILV